MNTLNNYLEVIKNLCKSHNVDKLYAFGSVLSEKFNDTSDIDLVVRFKHVDLLKYSENYYNFKFSLEDLLNRHVDLLEDQSIKNPYLKQSIDETKQLIYG